MSASKKVKINSDNNPENADDQYDGNSDGPSTVEASGSQNNRGSDTSKGPDGATKDAAIAELEKQLDDAKAEAKESYDRLLRVSAEFENFKKRSAKEADEFRKFANQELIKSILPIVDNLELALKASSESNRCENGLTGGVELTLKEMFKIFKNHEVEPIESLGKPFDPRYHEAVMREETEEQPENTVVNEMQRGYLMHGRLLRPAMVVVAMPKSKK